MSHQDLSAVSAVSTKLVSFGTGGQFGLGFGRISMPMIVTTTNAANVTAKNEQVYPIIQRTLLTNCSPHVLPLDFFNNSAQVADGNNRFIQQFLNGEHGYLSRRDSDAKRHTSIAISCCLKSALDSFFLLSNSIWILEWSQSTSQVRN